MKLPPLTAIRHFSTAAAHLSFKEAARELCVTEGAISRQIKLLEDYLGCPLFIRLHRGVQLSEEGEKLFAATDPALFQIAQTAEQLREGVSNFTLSVTTSFTIRWLMPRLSRFEKLYPNIPINLQTISHPKPDQTRRFDASIIYLLGDPLADKSLVPENGELLMVEWLLPVCAPGYLKGGQSLAVDELADQRIIFNEPTGRDWRSWAQKMDDIEVPLERALRFEHDDTAIQAAVAGHGIALANQAYIENEQAMGSLVPALDCKALPIGGHYLIREPAKSHLPHVRAFRDWVVSCAQNEKKKENQIDYIG